MTIRTRFAPSPTGAMHIGNLKAALYEYLIARSGGGKFILRIEDTDRARYVPGAEAIIYNTLKLAGITHDEGPDVGGDYGPYVQSERQGGYMRYALELIEKGKAYYCFCDKERLETLTRADAAGAVKYDRHCLRLSKEEIQQKLDAGAPYVIRQLIPAGRAAFTDEVFGDISVGSDELDDQVLIKSDGFPTYNFANVIDDHLMAITHVVRGSEYLSSTPKYNCLYDAFGWDVPKYVHLPLLLNEAGEKFSKRRGDAGFEDLIKEGFLPEAVVNYVALLGWSPRDNQEVFTLAELERAFDIGGLSKSPSRFDRQKLLWFNGEHIKRLDAARFYELAEPFLKEAVKRPGVDLAKLAAMAQSRVCLPNECAEMFDFIDRLPDYDAALYTHKKMKTDAENSLAALNQIIPAYEALPETDWRNDKLYDALLEAAARMGVKNGQTLWPARVALSGKASTPCGASEIAEILGKAETLARLKDGAGRLQKKG